MRNSSCSQPRPRKSSISSTPSSLRSKRYVRRCAHTLTLALTCALVFYWHALLIRFKMTNVMVCCYYSLQDSEYVIAERNFVTDDRSKLSFHKSDIIRLQVMDGLENGKALWCVSQQSCYLFSESGIDASLCVLQVTATDVWWKRRLCF